MSTVLGEPSLAEARSRRAPWIAVIAGLAALYVPTYVSFARGIWRDDAYAHGPIILLVFAWLAWRERAAFAAPAKRAPFAGALLLVAGLVLYIAGRSLGIAVFEAGSHLPVIAGLVLIAGGTRALRRFAFPLALLVFVVPLPGFVLDLATTPLKTAVSTAVAAILDAAGYPVTRSGVVLDVGDHAMLVADACSGLNSIYSLVALALVYAHVTPPQSRTRTALLLAAIVPIALAANIVRVTLLVLVSYHAGDEAAQGFVHGFAGILVFLVALALLLAFDTWARRRTRGGRREARDEGREASVGPSPVLYLAAVAMASVAIAAPVVKPAPADLALDLERIIPATFGEWHVDPEGVAIAPTPDVQANLDRIYRQVVSRTYVNAAGERMMLTVAHGGDQSDALKAHRQEKCYEAQGFEISALEHGDLVVAGRTIAVTRMVATRGERVEPVTYWFTMGDRVVLGRVERLRVQVAAGLAGRIPDGMLVRVSSLSSDPARAFGAQQSFAAAVFQAIPAAHATRFVGARNG